VTCPRCNQPIRSCESSISVDGKPTHLTCPRPIQQQLRELDSDSPGHEAHFINHAAADRIEVLEKLVERAFREGYWMGALPTVVVAEKKVLEDFGWSVSCSKKDLEGKRHD
jgi:hypothetical protein